MVKKVQRRGDYRDIKIWEISVEELVIRYGQGERNFAGANLIVDGPIVDLQGFDLQGINLRGAVLSYANLTGANLTGADLTGAVISSATLDKAIIREANLCNVNLHETSLIDADLRNSNLTYVYAFWSIFCGAKLDGLEWSVLAYANFRDADITEQLICRAGNLIWDTVMPDGSIARVPKIGQGG